MKTLIEFHFILSLVLISSHLTKSPIIMMDYILFVKPVYYNGFDLMLC